jgi:alkanesulfonate monooxygenase SsuD/methylene tetrahydromethanopterin reductase-like flavin-dependent oxidoreductase (luciferase family)
MVGLNVVVADSDARAQYLFSSLQQRFLGMVRGRRGTLPPPVDDMDARWNPAEAAQVARMLAESIVGSPATVKAGLAATQARTGADEFIVACAVHDFGARLRSYELLARLP